MTSCENVSPVKTGLGTSLTVSCRGVSFSQEVV